jgi:O-antigen ligase
VSALWSDFPELSIKRSFQLFIIYLVVIEALLFVDHNVLLKQLKIVVSLYLFINLFAGKFIPAAIDPIFGTWRGMETTKNEFAQTSFYCLLSAIVLFNFNRTKWTKTYDSLLMLLAVYLIYKSHSSTATIAVAIIVFMVSLFMIESIFPKFGFGRSVLGLVFIYILSFGFILLIFSSEIFGLIPGYFGKDMTLSGRVPIWEYVWTEIEKRQLLGYGFATYWVMGHSRILVFADYFEGFMVNQSHNGYLEIILQLGIVGFIFFLFLLVAITYRMIKLNNNLGIIIIVSILTLNFTESVLFKIGAGGVSTFAFISTYTALSVFHFNLRQVNHNEKNLFKYIGESEISYLQSAFTYKKDGFLFKTKR